MRMRSQIESIGAKQQAVVPMVFVENEAATGGTWGPAHVELDTHEDLFDWLMPETFDNVADYVASPRLDAAGPAPLVSAPASQALPNSSSSSSSRAAR